MSHCQELKEENKRLSDENERLRQAHKVTLGTVEVKVTGLDVLREAVVTESDRLMSSMGDAWVLLANASHNQNHEWQVCFRKWRDEEWHPALERNLRGKGGE